MEVKVVGDIQTVTWQVQNNMGYCYVEFKERYAQLSWYGFGDIYNDRQTASFGFEKEENLTYATLELLPQDSKEENILRRTPFHIHAKDYFIFCWPPKQKEAGKCLYQAKDK